MFGVLIEIRSSAKGLKFCVITVGIKKCKSIIKKNKKKHNKIVLLAKSKLNTTEVLIYRALIDSNIGHNSFLKKNNLIKQYERRNSKFKDINSLSKIYKTGLLYCLKCRKNRESKIPKVARTKNEKIILLLKCSMCDSKESKFIKKQEVSGLLSDLGTNTPLVKFL